MEKQVNISLFEVVGNPLCVASDDGQKVYERLAEAIRGGGNITLSFKNISTLTSAFLNAAIGQLYGNFSEEKIRTALKVEDVAQDDLALLNRVIKTAKEYFHDRGRFDQAYREELGDDGDDE
ncbi:MAG TPA: hypothetical protein DEB25_06495 [Desulfobulbaceae bacterium]|nr:hypothetical protein [Desulfobulbaceae bacterium]